MSLYLGEREQCSPDPGFMNDLSTVNKQSKCDAASRACTVQCLYIDGMDQMRESVEIWYWMLMYYNEFAIDPKSIEPKSAHARDASRT